MNFFPRASVLLFGATGMLGHTLFARMVNAGCFDVIATVRNIIELTMCFSAEMLKNVVGGVDADNFDMIVIIIGEFSPQCVINRIGIIKQLSASTKHIPALSINSLFPHRLVLLCKAAGARLIHISGDCIFDGMKGRYRGEDTTNTADFYGRTKFLGEVTYPHCVTLRI